MRKPTEKPYFAIREPESEENRPIHEQIEIRAYQIYIEHGRVDGHDLEDWLQAERELAAKPVNPGPMTKRATA